jgi:hypothetical protein
MTPEPAQQPQREYICNNDDLSCLRDYFYAALDQHEFKTDLICMWEQEFGVIRARPHLPAPEQGTSKLCFGTITMASECCRACNEIETCKQKQSVLDYQKAEAARTATLAWGSQLCAYLHYSHGENERMAVESKGEARHILKGRMFEDCQILEALEELRITGKITIRQSISAGDEQHE